VAVRERIAAAGAPLAIALLLAAPGGAAAAGSVDSLATVPAPGGAPVPAASLWPWDVQMNAPSINSASPDLLDRGELPALAGVAWDERLQAGPNDRAITLGVTPLAIARVVHRDERRPAGAAAPSPLMRRVSARVTIGGPLQKVERGNAGRAGRPT